LIEIFNLNESSIMNSNIIRKLEKRTVEILSGRQSFPIASLATVLYGGSLLYGAGAKIRQKLFASGIFSAESIERPVISIGNLTAGGTGKTPMTVHLTKLLLSLSLKVMIVSRGYKSLNEKAITVVSDGSKILCDAQIAGDEPYLMARLVAHVPVVVGKNRYKAALAGLQHFDPDVIVLDDAFQHLALARDLNLLLLDAEDPVGNGYLLPRGPLREPVSALRRADAIVFTRSHQRPSEKHRELGRMIHPNPVFHCRHTPVLRCVVPAMHLLDAGEPFPPGLSEGPLQGRSVFAFSALARNENFRSAVAGMGASVLGSMGFPDHHRYCRQDIDNLVHAARCAGCLALVTTDKDFVRLPRLKLPMELIVLGVDIDFGDAHDRWKSFIVEQLTHRDGFVDRNKSVKGVKASG
jgi:tetraacyldisaccharide 4'-kinase